MFDKNYLGHNFKRVSPSHEEYICEKCGIDIEHVDSDLLKNHKLKKKYKGNLGYLLAKNAN